MQRTKREEEALLAQRERDFAAIVDEITTALEELAEVIGYATSSTPRKEIDAFAEANDRFWKWEAFDEASTEQRDWILLRLMFLTTVWLTHRYGGYLTLETDSTDVSFLRYVVVGYAHSIPANLSIDPFECARHYVAMPPGRSLMQFLNRLAPAEGARPVTPAT